MESKFVRSKKGFSEYVNFDELKYREEFQRQDFDSFQKWKERIFNNRLRLIPYLRERYDIKFSGKILEIGAGSCWLSSELSKIKEVSEINALDFSEYLLREVAPRVMDELNAEKSKITRKLGDFHDLDFENEYFDFVVTDSSLHHTEYLIRVLKEIKRVLKKEGRLIAIREPVRPLIGLFLQDRNKVDSRKKGIIENIYSLKEWQVFFKRAGFELIFYKINFSTGLKGLIARYLNGLIKADFVLEGIPK